MGSINEGAKKAVVWDFLGTFFTRSGYLIFSIFLARLLTPQDFGVIGMVLIFTGFAQALIELGFSSSIIQARTVDDTQLSTIFIINITIGIFLTGIFFFCAQFVSAFYKAGYSIKSITQALSFIFIINSLNSVQLSLLKRELKFKKIAQASLVSTIIAGVLSVFFAFYGLGIWSLVMQVLILGVVNSVIIWLNSSWRPRFIFKLNSVRELWNFGGYMFLDSIFAAVYARIDVFFIGKVFNPNILGLYLRSKSISNFVVEFSSQSISKVLFPAVSRVQENSEKVEQYLIKALDVTGLITFFLLGWMYLTASESIIILFGEKWTGSIVYYKWLALFGYGFPIGSILISALRGQGHSKLYFIRSLFIYLNASTAYAIGYYYGIDAFLLALVFTTGTGVLINIFFSKITTGIPFLIYVYHSFYFAVVALVAVGLASFLLRNGDVTNLYYIFLIKTGLFIFFFGGVSFLLRRSLILNLISLKDIFKKM